MDDKIILYGFVAGFLLNGVLAAQMLYYWNAPSAKALGKRKERITAQPGSLSAADTGASTAVTGSVPKKAPTTRRRG